MTNDDTFPIYELDFSKKCVLPPSREVDVDSLYSAAAVVSLCCCCCCCCLSLHATEVTGSHLSSETRRRDGGPASTSTQVRSLPDHAAIISSLLACQPPQIASVACVIYDRMNERCVDETKQLHRKHSLQPVIHPLPCNLHSAGCICIHVTHLLRMVATCS